MNILVKDDFEIDRYPHFTMNLKGHTIVGYREDKDNLWVKLKDKVSFQHDKNDPNSIDEDDLSDWDNELQFCKDHNFSDPTFELNKIKNILGVA